MRTKPYTNRDMQRLKCFRCGEPAATQWTICSDNNVYRPLCITCDVEANELLLRFVRDPNWRKKMKKYRFKRL